MQPDILDSRPFPAMALMRAPTQRSRPGVPYPRHRWSLGLQQPITLCPCGRQEVVSGSSGSIFVVALCSMCLMEMLSRQDLAWALGELTPVV